MTFYRLEHFHNHDLLYLGLFDSLDKIDEAVDYLITQPGFKLWPKDHFKITKVESDEINWENGFVRSEIYNQDINVI